MKKNFLKLMVCAVMVALASLSFVGCGAMEAEIQAQLEEANKGCPQQTGEGVTITKYAMEGDDVVAYCELDTSVVDIEGVRTNKKEITDLFTTNLKNMYSSDTDIKGLIDLIVTTNKQLIYRFQQEDDKEDVVLDNGTLSGL